MPGSYHTSTHCSAAGPHQSAATSSASEQVRPGSSAAACPHTKACQGGSRRPTRRARPHSLQCAQCVPGGAGAGDRAAGAADAGAPSAAAFGPEPAQ